MTRFWLAVVLCTAPVVLLAALTWRVTWPPWKRAAKVVLHPLLYAALASVIGLWSVPIAWLHQGAGLAGHIWFCRRNDFTWYAVEDPGRYVQLSRALVQSLARERPDPS